MTGGRFAPLTIMSNEDTDIDSMITTFNTAVTETASEILGKHRQKRKPWITAEILDLCDKRREPRKKRFEHEGSEIYKEVNNNIKRCMNKAKENFKASKRRRVSALTYCVQCSHTMKAVFCVKPCLNCTATLNAY